MALTPAQQIATSDSAIVARLAPDRVSYELVEIIKGSPGPSAVRLMTPASYEGTVLLVRPSPSAGWIVVGTVTRERAPLLRQFALSTPADDADNAQWADHVARMLPLLDDSERLIAAMAYDELTRAPYPALRTLKGKLAAGADATSLDHPVHGSLHTLLYGVAGGDADIVEQRLRTAERTKTADNLAALLAAYLELRGVTGVGWVERTYLTSADRTLPEIQAALLALSAHGDADGAVPRTRVIAAYRSFMKAHKPMASLVAHDLASWQYWDAGQEYVTLLRSNALADPASRVAAMTYLLQSPRADTRSAARAIAAASYP